MKKHKVLLIGSYAGQDSYGDKYLLKSVISQFQSHSADELFFVNHIHRPPTGEDTEKFPDVEFVEGLFSVYWPCHHHLHKMFSLPFAINVLLALCTLPIYIALRKKHRLLLRRVWRDASQASLLYFYGGTQLSDKWFWLNFIPLMLTIVLCRSKRVSVFFGPQQYGPQSKAQQRWMKLLLRLAIKDIRTRNVNDLALLNLPSTALLLDEVYSCVKRYPILPQTSKPKSYVLLNMRGEKYLYRDKDGEKDEKQTFITFLQSLQKCLQLPFMVFVMSGDSFSDDTEIVRLLEDNSIVFSKADHGDNEQEILQMALEAYGTISMSFHGCVLSLLANCPAVPMTAGSYYDYKYLDFSRYSGQQHTPIISLDNIDQERDVQIISDYFNSFSVHRLHQSREQAAHQIKEWYREIARFIPGSQSNENASTASET